MSERFIEQLRKIAMPYGAHISGIESAIVFLEEDPMFFRSGYLKADLLKILSRVELKHSQMTRLRKIALAIVDKKDCREFRWYCRLACKVQSPELKNELQQRMNSVDSDVQRRAHWMLTQIARKDEKKHYEKNPS